MDTGRASASRSYRRNAKGSREREQQPEGFIRPVFNDTKQSRVLRTRGWVAALRRRSQDMGHCRSGGIRQGFGMAGFYRFIIEKLGHDRTLQLKVVGKDEVQQSYYGQLVLGEGVSSSLDEQLVKEARKAVSMEKQRVAEEVASILKLSVDIDTSSTESTDLVVATLRAGAEYAGLPVQSCVLIAGSQSGVVGAERIGIPSVVIRSSSTARAEFRRAKAVMDGFGGADLTVSKLLSKRFADPS